MSCKLIWMFMKYVESCPQNEAKWKEAAKRLNCGVDKHGRSLYVCVPYQDLTAIVEDCFESTAALYQRDNCLVMVGSGYLDIVSCTNFMQGCPKNPFRITDLYKYPACHKINRKDRCFHADPTCLQELNKITSHERSNNILNSSTYNSLTVAGFTLGIVSLVLIIFALFFFIKKLKEERLAQHNEGRFDRQALLHSEYEEGQSERSKRLKMLMKKCTETMRNLFDMIIPANKLRELVINNSLRLKHRLSKEMLENLNAYQENSTPLQLSSKDFDLTVMYILLLNSDLIQPPSKGWGRYPEEDQTTEAVDIERIQHFKKTMAHRGYDVDIETFNTISSDLSKVLKRLQRGISQRRRAMHTNYLGVLQ